MAPDQLLPRKTRLETSYAFSRTFNSRNIEFYWYPLWCQTFFDLVAGVPNLIVAPQFPVWIIEHIDQLEGTDDGDDPEEVEELEELEETAQGEHTVAGGIQVLDNDVDDEDYEPEVGAGDISFASTIPEKDARSVLVDFTVVRLTAVPRPEEKSRYGGWRVTAANVCLLVEVKRFGSRSLKYVELNEDIKFHIDEARADILWQAGCVFLQDETKDSVMAIAAAGPYWSGATIHRDDVRRTMDQLSNNDPSYRPPAEQLFDRVLKWNKILRLDGASSTVASENRLRTICKKMREMGDKKTNAK